MERRGVLIEGGVVLNIIVWGDASEAQYEAEGWDVAMETTDLAVQPGINWTWNEADGFRPPKPYASWTWNGVDGWLPPKPMPTDDQTYEWDESTKSWKVVSSE